MRKVPGSGNPGTFTALAGAFSGERAPSGTLARRAGSDYRSTSPRMNFSTFSRASSSKYWTGGDFMK